ncbi:uncharacterized protein SAPINGB_P006018 [Magnusiomyces paraingens]|uniref:Uncharacterized protein n=1 Tax=Magnusiomyces paraingens TaxID=2606893 RepID=A0A5E8C3Z4_9ASCO|nr:uncharacterized protein SAPINGB_P006018 [Saprochaete ingens]VVT58062.1 unnamed protein product [Saprochaete ingens]
MSTVPTTAKVLLLGDASVGKTSLRSQFIHHRFSSAYRSTVGGDFLTAKVHTSPDPTNLSSPTETISLQIWDTAGQERFDSLVRSFYRGTDVAILVYDVTNAASFSHLSKWLRDFVTASRVRTPIVIVVGNKIDKAEYRTVSERQACEFADSAAAANNLQPPPWPIPHYQTSSTSPIDFKIIPNNNANDLAHSHDHVNEYDIDHEHNNPTNLISDQSFSTALSISSGSVISSRTFTSGSQQQQQHQHQQQQQPQSSLPSSPLLQPGTSTTQQQQQLQQEPAIRCFEVSAKENIDVDRLFTYVADRIVAARRDVLFNFDSVETSDGPMVDITDTSRSKSYCC